MGGSGAGIMPIRLPKGQSKWLRRQIEGASRGLRVGGCLE